MLRGQPHRRVRGAVALIGRVALDEFEEDAAHGPGVAVPEDATRVPVVEDAEFAVGLQIAVGEVESGREVVVVVGRDREQEPAGRAEAARRGDDIVRGQRDVPVVDRVVARCRADGQGDPDAAVGVGDGAAAQQSVRVCDVHARLRVQAQHTAVEEGGLVEVVPGLGEREMIDAGHGAGRGGVRHVLEVAAPVGRGAAEEEFGAVGGGDRVQGRVLGGAAARQHRGEQGLGTPGGARWVG